MQPIDADYSAGSMRRQYVEILVGIFIAVGLFWLGQVALRLLDEEIETMIGNASSIQGLIASY